MKLNKTCTKCKKEFTVEKFGKDRNEKDGLTHWCKNCTSEYGRTYRSANQEKIRAYLHAYYAANSQKARTSHHSYYVANRERVNATNRAYRYANPEMCWARGSINNHKRKKFEVIISLEELTEKAKCTPACPYCGIVFDYSHGKKDGKLQLSSPTLDRIKNGFIISKDNTQILCHECNRIKGKKTPEELRMWALTAIKNIPSLVPEKY